MSDIADVRRPGSDSYRTAVLEPSVFYNSALLRVEHNLQPKYDVFRGLLCRCGQQLNPAVSRKLNNWDINVFVFEYSGFG